MASILVVGLNPAWQKIYRFPILKKGEVNRVQEAQAFASGKGFNTAKVLKRLGHEVTLLQFVGGITGDLCLKDCEAEGIRSLHVNVPSETRTCLTLLEDKGRATEVIEPFAIPEQDWGPQLTALLPKGSENFAGIAFCGTVPDGCPPWVLAEIMEPLLPYYAVMDGVRGLEDDFLRRLTCLKINRFEWDNLRRGLADPFDGNGPTVLVTDGGKPAAILEKGRELNRFILPQASPLQNPIGAGDTVTAGLLHFLLEGDNLATAFRKALAMGVASCQTLMPGDFSEADYQKCLTAIVQQEI